MRAGAQEENGCGEEPLAAQRLLGQTGVHLVALKRACACPLSPKKREPCMAKTACSGGWATWGWSYLLSLPLPHLPSMLTESELLSSAGPER